MHFSLVATSCGHPPHLRVCRRSAAVRSCRGARAVCGQILDGLSGTELAAPTRIEAGFRGYALGASAEIVSIDVAGAAEQHVLLNRRAAPGATASEAVAAIGHVGLTVVLALLAGDAVAAAAPHGRRLAEGEAAKRHPTTIVAGAPIAAEKASLARVDAMIVPDACVGLFVVHKGRHAVGIDAVDQAVAIVVQAIRASA